MGKRGIGANGEKHGPMIFFLVVGDGNKKQELKQPTAQFLEAPNYTSLGTFYSRLPRSAVNNRLYYIRNTRKRKFPLQRRNF
ncbi:hypothetical protein CDAR_295781 [Caerostris darwini]|uniref:Uncharacterized protein n=1 Tax=Caerostris darwini TaxID=1538125 RepID=A0AAV4NFI7_9ARAC|nr:hypothetical protein CDAR_295781 [Caerostris darwini]